MSYTDQLGTDIGYQYDDGYADTLKDNSDIGIISGLDNLYQAIQNRLLTPMGSLLLHPTYGSRLHSLIGKGYNSVVEMLVKMMVAESLLEEPRIALIQNIDVSFDRNAKTIFVTVEIVSIYSSEVSVNVEIGE